MGEYFDNNYKFCNITTANNSGDDDNKDNNDDNDNVRRMIIMIMKFNENKFLKVKDENESRTGYNNDAPLTKRYEQWPLMNLIWKTRFSMYGYHNVSSLHRVHPRIIYDTNNNNNNQLRIYNPGNDWKKK